MLSADQIAGFLNQLFLWNRYGVGMVTNGCGQSGDRTLELTVSEG